VKLNTRPARLLLAIFLIVTGVIGLFKLTLAPWAVREVYYLFVLVTGLALLLFDRPRA
jgi:hypothetical protein